MLGPLSVFARVPEPQNVDIGAPDLVPHFILSNEDPANFSGFEFFQFLSDARMFQQPACCSR